MLIDGEVRVDVLVDDLEPVDDLALVVDLLEVDDGAGVAMPVRDRQFL